MPTIPPSVEAAAAHVAGEIAMGRALGIFAPAPTETLAVVAPKKKKWKPRSSGLGYYFQCDYRAALDKLAHQGEIEKPVEKYSPYADHGTCCHYVLQMSLPNMVWGAGDSISHHPTEAQRENAATLFAGDRQAQLVMATKVADLARRHLPFLVGTTEQAYWRAEDEWKYGRKLTGHTDLTSSDFEQLVDLKTTSRKPDHNRIKAEHYVQMMAYKLLNPRLKVGHVLYVESMRASWAMLITIDFETPESIEFIEHMKGYIDYLNSSKLESRCVPRLGAHCQNGFCPWVEHCRDKYIPGPGVPTEAPAAAAPTRATAGVFDATS